MACGQLLMLLSVLGCHSFPLQSVRSNHRHIGAYGFNLSTGKQDDSTITPGLEIRQKDGRTVAVVNKILFFSTLIQPDDSQSKVLIFPGGGSWVSTRGRRFSVCVCWGRG